MGSKQSSQGRTLPTVKIGKVTLRKFAGILIIKDLAAAQECFPASKQLLPQVFNTANGQSEYFTAVTGTKDFLIFGGQSQSTDMWTTTGPTSVALIVRMDLATNVRQWARTFGSGTDVSAKVQGLVIKNNGFAGMVAVYAVNPEHSTDIGGHNIGYFWTIKTSNGGYYSDVLKITHSTNTSERWMTSSAAMFFTQHDKIVVAF